MLLNPLHHYDVRGFINKSSELENQGELVVKANKNNRQGQVRVLSDVHVFFPPEALHIFDEMSGERISQG